MNYIHVKQANGTPCGGHLKKMNAKGTKEALKCNVRTCGGTFFPRALQRALECGEVKEV